MSAPPSESILLRERVKHKFIPPPQPRTVHILLDDPPHRSRIPTWPTARLQQQADRIRRFQRRWERIKADLPPQLSRKHINMISIGGVVGTGLFVGSADSLRNGGPLGVLLGYSIVGTVVYSLCVSIGEMIAFLPNVGGVVGLADLYVDPALGFSLGWAAWYNWVIVLPAEITAAVVVIGYWTPSQNYVVVLSALFWFFATAINCFTSRWYGQLEYYFSWLKVGTIVAVIVLCLVIDAGWHTPVGYIGFRYWKENPFPDNYLGITGSSGHFLGFWAVLMQASFSFMGSEVPGIVNKLCRIIFRNVPRALRNVWIRITLFYLGGMFAVGLVVPSNDPGLLRDDGTGRSSPFVIAFSHAGWRVVSDVVNAAILVSAWSAAVSDIYVGSRFLFFLARRGHAPAFLGYLLRFGRGRASLRRLRTPPAVEGVSEEDEDEDVPASDSESGGSKSDDDDSVAAVEEGVAPRQTQPEGTWVIPLTSVLVSASLGLLTFLSTKKGPNTVFSWLVGATSIASLQSWAAMLFTYIRWYQGTVHHEKKYQGVHSEEAEEAREMIAKIKKNRQRGQPYLAFYAFFMCILVLLLNGWAVFIHNGWRIADVMPRPYLNSTTSLSLNTTDTTSANTGNATATPPSVDRLANPVSIFLSSYIPLPFFILLTFGYKLIKQTRMMPLDEMTFPRGNAPPIPLQEDEPEELIDKIWAMMVRWVPGRAGMGRRQQGAAQRGDAEPPVVLQHTARA